MDHLIKDCPEEADQEDESGEGDLAGMMYARVEDVCPLTGLTLHQDRGYISETDDESMLTVTEQEYSSSDE